MELDLVQRVELKLLLADSDEKLTAALAAFLAPLLQKLASPNVEVVQKVVEVLKFVKMRKTESRQLKFPLLKLIELYHKFMYDFSPGILRQNRQILSFIGQEIAGEHDLDDQNLLNMFVLGLRNDNVHNENVRSNVGEQFSLVLRQLVRVLENADPLKIGLELWDADDRGVLQRRLTQLFLLNLRKSAAAHQPLLDQRDVLFFTDHNAKNGIILNPENDKGVNSARKAALKVAHAFPDQFKSLLVAAMGDPLLDISRQARSDVLKLRAFDTEFLEKCISYGNDALSAECLDLLIRERSFDGIQLTTVTVPFQRNDLRLRFAALRLLRELTNTSTKGNQRWPVEVHKSINKMLQQYIIDDGWPRSQLHSSMQIKLRQLCYEMLGAFAPSKSTLAFLFQSLERDSAEMAQSIQKSLSWILESHDAEIDHEKLLEFMQTSQNSRTRYAAVKFAQSRLDATSPIRRIICLLGLDPAKNRSDVSSEAQRGLLAPTREELPEFRAMMQAMSQYMDLANGTSDEVVTASLLFLLATLARLPLTSMDWQTDMKNSLTLTSSPLENQLSERLPDLLPYVRLLLTLMSSEPTYEIIPLLLRKIFLVIPDTDKQQLASSGVLDAQAFVRILNEDAQSQQGDAGYGAFVAEYLPQLAPHIDVSSSTNDLGVLAQAFHAAILRSPPSAELTTKVIETKNVKALEVLSAVGQIKLSPETKKASASSQMALACLAVHTELGERGQVFSELVKMVPQSFDEIVANGEAISVAASGWHSRVLRDRYPYLTKLFQGDDQRRDWSMEEQTLQAVVNGIRGSPESRRIAAIRLLCLTQYSFYDSESIKRVASGVQSCFMSLLSDSDEVIQESAGRGLGILFENSREDKSSQNMLLDTLLLSFTDDAKAQQHSAGTLTADRQIFEPGALPSESGGKKSISTYKDVLNLANETGDQSLVYKFMSLSANSQIWAGRKGIAFSLEQILAKSELADQIYSKSELGQRMIPKLFRYLYDPVTVTRDAMKHIWSALVPSTRRSQVAKLYLPEIKKILIDGVIDREWRVREASTLALSDLVSQGHLEDTVELWKAGFRAVDDIKESVNTAGSELLKTLTNSLVRSNSAGRATDLTEIVPFLIKGIGNESTVDFSVTTLLKLSETKGFKPYAAGVLEELTLQLSSLEPQALNYLALKTNQNLVDDARVKGLRSSPIMQGIEAMVERGAPSTEEMWVILPKIVKKGLGVSSKLAGAKLIMLTSMQTYGNEKPGTEQLLNAAFDELWSSNDVVSEHYASALGYLARQLSTPLLITYLAKLTDKFLRSGSDDEKVRDTVAKALKGLSTNASDAFSAVDSAALPLAFVGQFTTSASKSKAFSEAWESNTGGTLSLKMYKDEILELCLQVFQDSSVRDLKIAAAKAVVATLAQGDTNSTTSSSRKLIHALAKSVLGSLAGRSWPNKEFLFEAMVALYAPLAQESSDEISASRTQIEERVLNEIQRKNAEYKLGILPSTARFFQKSINAGTSEEYRNQLEQQLVEACISVSSEDTDEAAAAFKTTLQALDSSESFITILEAALPVRNWKFRVAACESARSQSFSGRVWYILTERCASDDQHEKVRLEWCRTALVFKTQSLVRADVEKRLAQEKSSLVLTELKAVLK